MNDIQVKLEALQRRHNEVTQKKARLAGELSAHKESLARTVQEIREAGYDPKTVAAQRDRVKAELEAAIAKADADLTEVEQAFAGFPATK